MFRCVWKTETVGKVRMERLQNETVWTGKRRQERADRKERTGKSGQERAGRKEQTGKSRRGSADEKIQKGKYNYKNTNRKEQKAKYRRKSAGRNGEQTSMYETVQEGNRGRLPVSCAWFGTGGRLPHGPAFRHAADKFSKTEPSARENHVQKVK